MCFGCFSPGTLIKVFFMMAAVKRLFIGGLPAGIKENDLTERFSRFGEVKTVELKIRKDEGGVPTKTFAYINIETSDEQLKKCCSTYNNAKWKGSEMKIQLAKENFLERLEKERQQQKEIPVEDIACQTIPLKKPGEDAGVKDFQLKAKPGTQVPGEKDWVVGKYGRVLPIVNIQKKGYRGKTVTVDPSKFTHCLKAIKDEEAKVPVSTVSSLTWELDVQDNEITKKRKGEFPQWKKGKKSKGMDAASWLKQQEEERQRLLALEPELEIVPLSEGVGRPSGVNKTGSKHTAKSNVEFNSDSGDSDDESSIVVGLNGTHKNVLNDLSRFDSDSDNDKVEVNTKSNFVGRANDLPHSGSKASSVKSQDNFIMLNPKNIESEAKAEKIHGKGEKKPILPKRNLKQVQKLQGFRGTKFLDDSDTECGKQTKRQSINIDDVNVKSAVASLVKEGENCQKIKKNTADTKIPEKHLGSGKKVIDRIGKGKVSKIVKKDESEEESSTNSSGNGDDNEEGETSDAVEISEDSCEDENSDDNIIEPNAMEVSEESDDVSSPDTDEIFKMTQNSRKFTEKLVGEGAKQSQKSLKKNLNSPSKSSKMVADSHSKAKESVKNTESLIPIVGAQGIEGSFLTKRLLCDEFNSGIDFSTGSAVVSKIALDVNHDSEDDNSDFESLVKKAEAKLKSSKGKQNTLLNVQESLNISNLVTNVQKGYHSSSDEEEDIAKTNTAEVNKPKSVLQKTFTDAPAKKQVDKDTGDVSESESDSESSEEQSDNASNEDDSGDGSDTIASKNKIDKKVNKAKINRNSQDKPDKAENKDKMKNINGKDKDVSDTESNDDTGSSNDDDEEEEEVSEGDGDTSNTEESDIDFESLVAQEVAKVDSSKSINVADCSSDKKDIKVKSKTNKQSEKSKLSSVQGLSDSSNTNFDLSQNKKQDALNSKKEDLTKNSAGTSSPLQKDKTSNKATTKSSEASRHTPEDKEKVDRKRLQAVKQRVKENEAQKSAIQMALAKDASGTNTNKRIVFDSDSESNTADPETKSLTRQDSSSSSDSSSEGDEKIEKHKQGSKTDDTNKTSKTLFDSSEDDDSDDDDDKSRFDLRPEFEGTAGKKLLKLQSRYGDDQRFKLDQRFDETDSDGEEEKGAVVAGSDDEKMRSLRILQSITGTTITAPLDVKDKAKKTFKDVSNLKYDPSKEDHSQFEIKMAEKKKKDKKTDSKKSSAAVEEIPPVVIPEVSRERFHEVSESLKLAFTHKTAKDTPTNQGFSLLAAFGHHNEEEDRMSDDNDDAEAIPIPATLRSDQLSLDNRFKVTADHSDTDGSSEGEEEAEVEMQGKRQDQSETMETEETESHKSTPSSFFFNEEDERLKEGAKFYRKLDVAATREKWLKTRHDYIENFRSKHKRSRHSHSSTPSNKPGQKFTGHRGRGGKRRF